MGNGTLATLFDDLQRDRLIEAWRADLPESTVPRVMIGLPSYANMPTIERIYAVDYGAGIAHHRLEKELRYMRELRASGIDPLVADGRGWSRAELS